MTGVFLFDAFDQALKRLHNQRRMMLHIKIELKTHAC